MRIQLTPIVNAKALVAITVALLAVSSVAACSSTSDGDGSGGPGQSGTSSQSSATTSSATATTTSPVATGTTSGGSSSSAAGTKTTPPGANPVNGAKWCVDGQIGVVGGSLPGGSAAGHTGVLLSFTNHSSTSCTLFGYPGAAGLNASGAQIQQATRTLDGFLAGCRCTTPPTVLLAPGASAAAVAEGNVGEGNCDTFSALLVTPPNTSTSVKVALVPHSCGFTVHPVIPSASVGAPRSDSNDVLGPYGWQELVLGMSRLKALGTGIFVSVPSDNGQCQSWGAAGAAAIDGAAISPKLGIINIAVSSAAKSIHTIEGMQLGWTAAQVHAAYPAFAVSSAHAANGPTVAVPQNAKAVYRLHFDAANKLTSMLLESYPQDCYA